MAPNTRFLTLPDSPARRESPNGRRLVRDLAMLAQLLPLARLGKRHRDCVFVHIQADVDDTLPHDPSPMHEARRWSTQRKPRQPAYRETGRPISGEHLVSPRRKTYPPIRSGTAARQAMQ